MLIVQKELLIQTCYSVCAQHPKPSVHYEEVFCSCCTLGPPNSSLLIRKSFTHSPPLHPPMPTHPHTPTVDSRHRSGQFLELNQTVRHWQPLLDAAGLDIEVVRSGVEGWVVECEGGEVCWRPMVTTHWPKLLQHYGYSIEER